MVWLALLASYLLGAVPTAYLLVKRSTGRDVRTIGSGNVGATNAMRAAGKRIGLLVFVLDGMKGVVSAAVIPRWLGGYGDPTLSLACGLAAVVGHDFSCFLRFEGGKGVATTIGALLGSMPIIAGIMVASWALVFWLTRYVSMGSLAAAAAIPISQWWMGQPAVDVGLGGAFAALIVVRHRANVQRLRHGTEHRAGSGRSHATLES